MLSRPAFVPVTFVPSALSSSWNIWSRGFSPCVGSCSLSVCFLFLVDSVSTFRSWKSLFLPFLHTGGVFPFNPGIFILYFFKNHQPSRNPVFLAVASCGILSTISLHLLHFLKSIPSILFLPLPFCEDWCPGGDPSPSPCGFVGLPITPGCFSRCGGAAAPQLCPFHPPVLPWGSGVEISSGLLCRCENPSVPFL